MPQATRVIGAVDDPVSPGLLSASVVILGPTMAVTPAAATLTAPSRRVAADRLAPAPSWTRSLRVALVAYGALRLGALLVAVIAGQVDLGKALTDPIRLFLPFLHLDAVWQVDIAAAGYQPYTAVPIAGHTYDGAAFLPAFPGLMHGLAALTGLSPYGAGLLLCAAAAAAGLAMLHRLALEDHGPRVATLAVVLTVAFPTAVYLCSAYTECLLLPEFAGAFLCVRRGRTGWAAVLAAAATVTKVYAVILVVPLAVEVVQARRADRPGQVRGLVTLGAGALAGVVALAAFYLHEFGQPLRFITAQVNWDHAFSAPWVGVQRALETIVHPDAAGADQALAALQLAVVALLGWATVYAWRELRPSYAAFLGLSLCAFITNGLLVSITRYALAVFPLAIVLAHWASSSTTRVRRLVTAAVPVSVGVTWLFVSGHFTG